MGNLRRLRGTAPIVGAPHMKNEVDGGQNFALIEELLGTNVHCLLVFSDRQHRSLGAERGVAGR